MCNLNTNENWALQPSSGEEGTFQEPSFVTRDMISGVFASQTPPQERLSACFTGHRDISDEEYDVLERLLDQLLPTLYRRGYRDFYCGGAIGFDTLAAEAVLRLKRSFPDAQLILALPCATQTKKWAPPDSETYERILYLADKIHVLSRHYHAGCMQERNRYMVDHSDLCVAYLLRMQGGTLFTVNYALDQKHTLLNLAMPGALKKFLKEK